MKAMIEEGSNGNGFKGKAILVVNTGSVKKKFILQRIKKLGLTIVVLNKEKNWAQPYVDHWILADTFNHSESLKAVDAFNKNGQNPKIDGVLTFWEDDVLLTSKIVDRFNFIGIPLSIAKQVRNKYLFREFCEKNEINTPRHRMVKNLDDIEAVATDFNFPLVIKPAYGSSSAYVVKVESKEDLISTFTYIKKNISSETESALSDGLEIFVEEFLDGDEVDIDIVLQHGKIKFSTISDNFNKTWDQFFVDSGQSIPSTLPEHNRKELIDLAEETLEKLGITDGCIHFEAKMTSNGAFPIEVNLRMGGDYVYSYNKAAWGLDLIENAIRIALGQFVAIKKPALAKKYIIGWDIHPDFSGLLVELNVDEELKKKKYFEELHFYKDVGDSILMPPEGYESLGWLTVSGDNFLDAQDNLRDALNYIKYKVVKFTEDSSLGKTSRKNRLSAAVLNRVALLKAVKLERVKRVTKENKRSLHVGIAVETSNDAKEQPDMYSHVEVQRIGDILKERGYEVTYFEFSDPIKTFNDIRQSSVDIIFNMCGMLYDDVRYEPHVVSMFDLLQIPYTGSDYLALSLCADKIKMKKLFDYHDIPAANWDYVRDVNEEVDKNLRYPLIVKPADRDGSIGITLKSVVNNEEELREQIKLIVNKMGSAALIEEYIEGDELDACILGNTDEDLRVLPLSRYIFDKILDGKGAFFSYEMKWEKHPIYNEDNVTVQRPAKLDKRLEALITEVAIDTYRIMGCSDFARVEFRIDKEGNPFVIEINPNPSLELDNNLANSAKLINLDYGDLIEEIIWLAIKRFKKRIIEYK